MPAADPAIAHAQAVLAGLTPLDWILLVIGAWSILRGLLHGAIRELFAILAATAALLAAYWQYAPVAQWLERWITPAAERAAVAFLLVAIVVFLAVTLVGRLVRAVAHSTGLGPFDRLAGALLGAARASLLGTILVTTLAAFLPTHALVDQSRLAPWFGRPAMLLSHLAPQQLQQRILNGILGLGTLQNTLP